VRVAVVGHVEWVDFARVARVPVAGEIVEPEDVFAEPAGGGAVAAVQLARLAGESTLITALGHDPPGRATPHRLAAFGVQVDAATRDQPTRRAFTFLDAAGERTITTIGERIHPRRDDSLRWDALDGADAVYFAAGDAGALRAARGTRVLVATARVLPTLAEAGVELDALVGSGRDAAERYEPGDLDPPPRLVVTTGGAKGGTWTAVEGRSGEWAATPPPGPVVDSYGCGDSFAGGLTFALGRGLPVDDALALAARCGATCLAGRGPYGRQLGADEI
jgi:ribokinase